MNKPLSNSSLIFYQTEDGQMRIEVRLEDESVWLSQKLMAELFQKDIRTINEHIQNIYSEGELNSDPTIRKFRIVQIEGSREVARSIDFYNLDVIISVGYRVSSHYFFRMTERDILSHAGTISHEEALDKARTEYVKYQKQAVEALSPVERHFLEAVREVEQIGSSK